ncbi:MAG: hypothetical protein HYV99_05385 [Betaproteobacteria bacterium]|nr:hypothetical protein [Betaproteobacteria bacterium]
MRPDAGTPFEGALTDPGRFTPWYRSRASWRFVLARFVPLLAAGNLVWEIFQLSFYTLWEEGTPRSRAFAVAHCTIGDVMIGTAALLASVMLFGRHGWPSFGYGRVLAAATFAGVAYTVFSSFRHSRTGWRQCSIGREREKGN